MLFRMSHGSRRALRVVAAGLVAAVAATRAHADAARGIAAEAERWIAIADRGPADPSLAGLRQDAESMLRRAVADAGAGRTALALEELGRGRSLLRALALRDEAPAAAADAAAFARLWESRSRALVAQAEALRRTPWKDAPAATRAVAESAQGKIATLVEASRAYAAVTSPGDGLFYLGQAVASAELAAFARGLHDTTKTPLATRSMLPELQALQQRVNAAFQPPRSIERHADFIRLNATLKLAFELDAAALYAGALYQYLDATQQLALLGDAPPAAPGPDLAAWRGRLGARDRDDSLGRLFLERAEAALAAGARAEAKDLRLAQVVADDVLPAYQAALAAAGAATSRTESAASVTVTLVRWPYT